MLVHITAVNSKPSTRKDGTAVLSKSGKPLYSVGIKTAEHGDTWLNGLMPFNPDRWDGTEQELEIYDEEYNGKTYKKFKLPARQNAYSTPKAADTIALSVINTKLDQIIGHLSNVKRLDRTSDGKEIPFPDTENW